jgi:hypothetical protein
VHPDKALVKDGRAFKVNNLRWVEGPQLMSGYRLSPEHPKALSSTGLLELFRLVSDDPTQRSFVARWDNEVDRRNASQRVKTYLLQKEREPNDVFETEHRLFKNGRTGYSGHHPAPYGREHGWTFDIEVRDKDGILALKGILALGMSREIALEGALTPSGGSSHSKLSNLGTARGSTSRRPAIRR